MALSETWASKSDDKPEPTRPVGDVAFVMGKNADGVHIMRRRDENAPIEAGLLQPLVEGRPITGELISMRRREDMPFLFDVKSEMAAPDVRTAPGAVEGRDRLVPQGLGRDLGRTRTPVPPAPRRQLGVHRGAAHSRLVAVFGN